MPTYSQVTETIISRIGSVWVATPVAYENVEPLDYSDPNRPLLSAGQSPYLGIKVTFGDSSAVETGPNAIKRTWGYIETAFYCREASGTKTTQANLDAFAALFEYRQINGIVFKEITGLEPVTVGGWYVTNALLRFYFHR